MHTCRSKIIIIVAFIIIAATCGPPAPPPNGIIAPYSNTLEGAMVTCVCWTLTEAEHQPICKEMNITAVCSAEGNWEPNLETICAEQFDSCRYFISN